MEGVRVENAAHGIAFPNIKFHLARPVSSHWAIELRT